MRATEARIHLDRLWHNLEYALSALEGAGSVCVAVKANAYGHGLVGVGRFLQRVAERRPLARDRLCLGVATVDEGVGLREAGVALPIWLFSYADESELACLYRYRLEPFVGDGEYCRAVLAAAPNSGAVGGGDGGAPLPLHIKIDSGMGRIGCRIEELPALYRAVVEHPAVRPAALCTHLADAYDADYTAQQYEYFDRACALVAEQAGAGGGVRHAANSGSILSGDGRRYEAARPGVMIYGYDSDPRADSPANAVLRPVMELRSRVVALKRVERGRAISYGMTWRAPRATQIATIPVGYGDGYSRRLSGVARVLVESVAGQYHLAPVVGRICMDQCMVDVEGVGGGVRRGARVVLFGDARRRVGADLLARQSDTISYEITTAIHERVPRVYIEL